MKIFGNPRIKIPQILETDINDKIIVAYKITPEGNRFLESCGHISEDTVKKYIEEQKKV